MKKRVHFATLGKLVKYAIRLTMCAYILCGLTSWKPQDKCAACPLINAHTLESEYPEYSIHYLKFIALYMLRLDVYMSASK